jgi:4-amino-4-deoxy-L-arabinose transferase-like glycosyltransferase
MRGTVAVRAVTAIALVIVAIATFRGLDRPMGNGDEVIYAQNVREMIRTNELTTLQWQGVDVLQRPSAPFVMASLGARIDDSERGLRLTSAASSFAILLLIFAIAFHTWKRYDAALIAVLLCAGVPTFHQYSRALLSDPPFVVGLVAAVWGAIWAQRDPRGLILCAAGMGLAVAMKSLAAGIPGLALLPWWIIAARKHRDIRAMAWSLGAFLLLAAPFYIIGFVEHGGRFWDEHIGYSLVSRAKGELHAGMGGGVFQYIHHTIERDGAMVLAWVGVGAIGGTAVAIHARRVSLGIAAGFALFVFVALSLVGIRIPHYLLPVYPAAALGVAGLYVYGIERAPKLGIMPGALLVPALAAALFLQGIATPSLHFSPSPQSVELGKAAGEVAAPDQKVYTFEWYAPAFAYYADRELVLLTQSDMYFEIVNDVDFFRAAGAVSMVPPLPEPGSQILVAGPPMALQSAAWMRVDEIVAQAEPIVLAVVTVRRE